MINAVVATLAIIGAITLTLSVLWKRSCDHDWHCIKMHQGHDIGLNVYQCTKCAEIDNRIE